MDLKEIITRNLSLPVEQEESLFVLQQYIKVRKGVDIKPIIYTELPTLLILKQLQLMTQLALDATLWFRNNLDKIQ